MTPTLEETVRESIDEHCDDVDDVVEVLEAIDPAGGEMLDYNMTPQGEYFEMAAGMQDNV
jgi:hypothetical protein